MAKETEIEAGVQAIYEFDCKRLGKRSCYEGATLDYWRKRVTLALDAAEMVRAGQQPRKA